MALSKSSTEYYNLEKVAEVLNVSPAEVNSMREQSKLRGFRDGNNWKFNKEEVHAYLAESIRSKGSGIHNPSDSGFDLAGDSSASASSFDLLVEEAALPADDQLISAVSVQAKSDLDLAALDRDDDLALAEETQISSLVVPKKAPAPVAEPKSAVLPVTPEKEDSSALSLASSDSDIESVLGAGGSSPQLGLAGDSGFDVLVAGETSDESEVLLVDEKTETTAPPMGIFELEPSSALMEDDDSDSSSQVMAIDVGLASEAMETETFDPDSFENFIGFDSGLPAPPAATGTPFGVGIASLPDRASAPIATATPAKAAGQGEEYSTGMLIALFFAIALMLLPGLMLIDSMVHIWSWDEPFTINGLFMSWFASMFGLT
jgi:excisionase family DNA binding protein